MKLRDDQWARIEPLLLGKQEDPGFSGRNNRLFIDAVIWRASYRGRWRDMPPEFGKWNTTYIRFKRWNVVGVWRSLAQNMRDDQELRESLEKIVAYGDEQIFRSQQLLIRNGNKQVYDSLTDNAKEIARQQLTVDDSVLHWVSLVTDVNVG